MQRASMDDTMNNSLHRRQSRNLGDDSHLLYVNKDLIFDEFKDTRLNSGPVHGTVHVTGNKLN